MVEPVPGAVFDDHEPQRYGGTVGMGETCDWNDGLIVTVDCALVCVGATPQAASRNSSARQAIANTITCVDCFILILFTGEISLMWQ